MGKKQTKRSRKFEASGGVKSRLEKGTITNKGKLKRKRRSGGGDDDGPAKRVAAEESARQLEAKNIRDENDFAGSKNLGDLDIDSFFAQVAQAVDDDEASAENHSGSEDSDSEKTEEDAEKEEKKEESESDSDSDSDDEDIEAAEARMKREMEKLKSSDPEFHEFLEENEQELLDFGGDEDEDDEEADSDEEADQETKKSDSEGTQLTAKVLKSLEQGAFKSHGIKSLKKLIGAYNSACHLADAPDDEQQQTKATGKKYQIDSPEVFDKLMVMCLENAEREFKYHLFGKEAEKAAEGDLEEEMDENKPLNPKKLESCARWKNVKPVLRIFFKATLHVISEAKEEDMLTFVLKACSKYIPYLSGFPRLTDSWLRALTSLWSAPLDSSEDYQVVRLNAFLRIRQLALTQPFPFVEDCLKKTYLAYAQRAKFGTASSVTSALPTLTFMGNCVVELYSLDYHSSYQHAFVYIRQLALHLRAAMQKKTPESFQVVYCWQFVHCLKLWTAVLAGCCRVESSDEEVELLRSLIYPLTEVILGTVRLIPSTRHLPLRLHCVRLLQQLAAAAELYIPTTPILLDVLDLKEFYVRPLKKKSRDETRGLRLALILKLPKESPLRTSEQLEPCMSEVFLLLNREVDLYRYSAGFPEFSVRICQRLRKFSKETKNGRWRAFAKGCMELCERYSAQAVTARSKLAESPRNVKRLEALLPANTKPMGERYEDTIAKERRLEVGSRPVAAVKETTPGEDAPKPKETKRKKKKETPKKSSELMETEVQDMDALEQEDEVQEGVDWSDSD